MKTLISILVVAGLVLVGSPAAAAAGDGREVHPDVAYALSAEPGGTATGYLSAEWPLLGMTLEVVETRAVGSCATGSVCAYRSTGLSGTKLSWSSCGTHSTAALSTVGSIANARSSGALHARQGTTVRATAAAGSSANVPVAYQSAITNVHC